jgi:hypothetical protein
MKTELILSHTTVCLILAAGLQDPLSEKPSCTSKYSSNKTEAKLQSYSGGSDKGTWSANATAGEALWQETREIKQSVSSRPGGSSARLASYPMRIGRFLLGITAAVV